MVILVSALLLALLVSLTIRVYRKNWNKNLTLSIAFASDAVFEGDQGELCETVANRKLLPLWWSDIRFELSDFIRFDDEGMGGRLYKKNTVSAFSYEMVKKTFAFTAAKRGYYTISGAELLTGDLFFRYKFIRRFPVSTGLYVYPDIRGVRRFSVDFRKIVGEAVVRRHMIEDPFEFRGIRDYSPFDSLRAVNWNATAKTGEIKVNEYSCTSSQEVLLLLDFDGYNDWDRQEIKEDVIRIAAYLAQ
ncbi:MAG: DUF58 domain-containing protein, partial [Clostridia bacterium]|nr:DUF58 domain-containing protein [Clostridia bacterium]